jgi:hypothetical protein
MACEPDARTLIVARRDDPEIELERTVDQIPWNQVAAFELGTVRPDRVELTWNVWPPHETSPGTPIGIRADDHHLTVQWRPFALHPKQTLARVEDQVVSTPSIAGR